MAPVSLSTTIDFKGAGGQTAPPENLKAAGNALFAPIPGSEPVNLAFACSYKRIFGWETGIRTPIRSSRVCSLTVSRSSSRGEQDHFSFFPAIFLDFACLGFRFFPRLCIGVAQRCRRRRAHRSGFRKASLVAFRIDLQCSLSVQW
jgi:hypothetical protein